MSSSLIERLEAITEGDVAYAATHIMSLEQGLSFMKALRELHQDAIAEIKRFENEAVLRQAEVDGATSMLLDVQKDCIAANKLIHNLLDHEGAEGWSEETLKLMAAWRENNE